MVNGKQTKCGVSAHLFSGDWCASSSTYALRRTTSDFPCPSSVKSPILDAMRVNDLLTSVPTLNEAVDVALGCKRQLELGGI